ncbi:MAG TPA: nickel pincer cofactor biosynthesis protein LarC [Bacteroidales bacterium]|nr:nickel pincer cofactor biosynthesis protein LarC [Bacteroidales bacterium]
MNVLYYDCFSGISGDMNLAALIDLGVDERYLRTELDKLNVSGYEMCISRDVRHAITGTRVDVELISGESYNHGHQGSGHTHHEAGSAKENSRPTHENTHEEPHAHSHSHGDFPGHRHDTREDHTHPHHHHGHSQAQSHDHVHRNLEDIRQIVEGSDLNAKVKERSMKMFRLIAEAEAKVHGTTVDKIHFHEVGAVDSIVDIVGAAICLDYLNVNKVVASTVELGGGFVKCAHGTMPVPAPATLEILKGIPVRTGAVDKETTTPTGAAILAANVDEFDDRKALTVEKTGYGIGHRNLDIPNILRVYLGTAGESQKPEGFQTHQALEISCNIDDMNPEHYEDIMERLFEAGADEVYITPVVMKKTRPASLLTILCSPGLEEQMARLIFQHTSTLGFRGKTVKKSELNRKMETRETRFGDVRVKTGYLDGKPLKTKPEYEDCKRIAREKSLSLQEVLRGIVEDIS